jgi:hypothetical protein
MTEPTDAEIIALADETRTAEGGAGGYILPISFARAVLAKWGTPPAVAPWRSAVLDLIDECPSLTMEQDRWLSRRVKELDFASTPQPTQPQAVAVPEWVNYDAKNRILTIKGQRYAEELFDDDAAYAKSNQAGAVPLTDEQIEAARIEVFKVHGADLIPAVATTLARAIEAAHGIGIKGGQHG